MDTARLEINDSNIDKAGEIIRRGGLVAFPTETVYGLGADALNGDAVRSVYAAKGRPSDNPMIVHIADIEALTTVADLDCCMNHDVVKAMMREFWPGPITFVMRKRAVVPLTTTGGLDTVGIRMPSSETARRFIRASQRPIAAPSANISGRPSPTTYQDVLEDMDGRIDAVLLGEKCAVGIESTVLDITGDVPTILRPGYVTPEMIAAFTDVEYDPALYGSPVSGDFRPKAPGMKYKHYAPKAQVRIVKHEAYAEILAKEAEEDGKKVQILDYHGDSHAAARDFFARLRELDRKGADLILVIALDDEEFGFSVMNRMLKSAGYDVAD